jgi:hypothetical protein
MIALCLTDAQLNEITGAAVLIVLIIAVAYMLTH